MTATMDAVAAGRLEEHFLPGAELPPKLQTGRCTTPACRNARALVAWRRSTGLLLSDARCPLHPEKALSRVGWLRGAQVFVITDRWARELGDATREARNVKARERKAAGDALVAADTHKRVAHLEAGDVLAVKVRGELEAVRYVDTIQPRKGGKRYLRCVRTVAALEAQVAKGGTLGAPWSSSSGAWNGATTYLEHAVTQDGLVALWTAGDTAGVAFAGTQWADSPGWGQARVLELIATSDALRARRIAEGSMVAAGEVYGRNRPPRPAELQAELEAAADRAEALVAELHATYELRLGAAQGAGVQALPTATLEFLEEARDDVLALDGPEHDTEGHERARRYLLLAGAELERRRAECSGELYPVNPDAPEEGLDVHHAGPCTQHELGLPLHLEHERAAR